MADPEEKNHRGQDEEDEEEEIDDTDYKTVKDAVLFAIDVTDSMLKKPPKSDNKKADRDSPTSAALKCAYQLMQQRIISNPNDMMGILLFGTQESTYNNNGSESPYPHCYLLADLDVPSAQDVKRLRDMVEDDEEASKVLIPSSEPASISTVLFCANQIFTTKAPNFSSRRLFLVTDNDDPAKHHKKDKETCITRARDLYDLGVQIELFPIGTPGYGFDRAKFYDDLIYPTSPDADAPGGLSTKTKVATSGDGITLLQSLLSSINSKAAARRALFNLPFEIGPDLKIGVKGFILIKRQEPVRSTYIWQGGERPQIVTSSTTHLAGDTAQTVGKPDIRKAYKFGGDAITFTPDEFKQIRQCWGDPVIRIIGFKSVSSLPIWAHTTKATFFYPSEQDYIGSTRVFAALHHKLLRDQKIGVAWYVARRNAAPVIAAILPGAEKQDENGDQTMPPGMWIVPLPYADDIRPWPETTNRMKTTDELTDMMRKVVQQLQLPKGIYDPQRYPNPALQWFYRILQAIALEEELPEQPDDKTKPKYKQIDKRAGSYVIEWGEAFETEFAAQSSKIEKHGTSIPSKKRGASSTAEGEGKPLAKRVKKEPVSQGDVTDEQIVELERTGKLSKQTVAWYKEVLGARGLHTSGKKADLQERLEGWLGEKGLA